MELSIQDTAYRIIYQNKTVKDIFGEHYGEYCYRIYEGNKKVCKGCPLKKVFNSGRSHKVIKTVKRDNCLTIERQKRKDNRRNRDSTEYH